MPRVVTPFKLAIVASGLTMRELAERTGFADHEISRWAAGRHVPIKRTRITLADALSDALGRKVAPEELWPEQAESEAA